MFGISMNTSSGIVSQEKKEISFHLKMKLTVLFFRCEFNVHKDMVLSVLFLKIAILKSSMLSLSCCYILHCCNYMKDFWQLHVFTKSISTWKFAK